jgi:hypothetical protein
LQGVLTDQGFYGEQVDDPDRNGDPSKKDTDRVQYGGINHCDLWTERLGVDHRSDGIRRVMEPVDEFKHADEKNADDK